MLVDIRLLAADYHVVKACSRAIPSRCPPTEPVHDLLGLLTPTAERLRDGESRQRAARHLSRQDHFDRLVL